jgi:DNA-directed RNA polymerase specialized sigma24 family protein
VTAHVGEPMTDIDLVTGFRRDPELFTTVHDRYFRDVYRYAAGRLDVQVAEDIAAETSCLAFGQRDRFDPERGSLRSWLFGIATNLVARHRRQEARRYRALARTGAERDVVLLVALGQLSYDEVAHALGISPGTVGSRLSRARHKLHDAIDQEAFDG